MVHVIQEILLFVQVVLMVSSSLKINVRDALRAAVNVEMEAANNAIKDSTCLK